MRNEAIKGPSDNGRPRSFYRITENEGGTVDVYLYHPTTGSARAMRGLIPWDGMEDDIRARFSAWYDSGEAIP